MARPILTVWQWNCRGYRKKRSHLQQLVQKLQADPQATEPAPDVIALQETSTPSTLPGYAAYHQLGSHASPCTSTLVHNGLTAVQHEIEATGIQHTLVEILPRKRTDRSPFVLNVYSSPREKAADFSHLFSETIALVGDAQLLLLGDFNARHPDWVYVHTDPKGRKLWSLVQHLRLTLLNDPQQPPTRIGNSVCRDTSPDLTLCKNVTRATWDNTGLLAGSDHNILAITIETRLSKKPKPTARITEWPKFRKLREERASDTITDINEWITSLQEHVQATTREVETTADLHTTDSRLLHMWDAHAGLLRRWRRQRHNKKLRRRLETLAREIENHSLALAQQQWGQLCDGLNGQMSSKRTWHLLRQLLDPCSSKLSAQKQLQRLLHRYPGTDAELLDELALRYVSLASPDAPPEILPPYSGKPNPQLDEDITEAEIYAAMLKLRTTSAPGPDGVSNKSLRNLDAKSVAALTQCANECWRSGHIPQEWRHAKLVFIPKPGKKMDITNLRPISLTSCLGKLIEHVVLARLQNYAEENDLFPPTMLGFRAHLSTQDALVQIHHDLLRTPPKAGTRAVLGLDLHKAFDSVRHTAIASNLAAIDPGERTYNYVCDFLLNRTIDFSLAGGCTSKRLTLGDKGTPQGAVLSPFLFNLALRTLPSSLDRIPGLRHTIYADDVTLWTTTGSDGQIEETLQRAADAVVSHATQAGLTCSESKSELLLLRPPDRRRNKSPPLPAIHVYVNGVAVPHVDHIRILGLFVQ